MHGDVLLNALADLQSRPGLQTRPLFAICHSVGGLLLKQALCIANEQSYRYGSVLSSIAGIIFLGTPHTGVTDTSTMNRLLMILTGTANLKKRLGVPIHRIVQEKIMLSQLATRFEDVNLQSPILSVAENRKTKVYEGILQSKNILVSNGHCFKEIVFLRPFNSVD